MRGEKPKQHYKIAVHTIGGAVVCLMSVVGRLSYRRCASMLNIRGHVESSLAAVSAASLRCANVQHTPPYTTPSSDQNISIYRFLCIFFFMSFACSCLFQTIYPIIAVNICVKQDGFCIDHTSESVLQIPKFCIVLIRIYRLELILSSVVQQ